MSPRDPLAVAICPACLTRVARRADACRHCGYEFGGPPRTIREMIVAPADRLYNDVALERLIQRVAALVCEAER